jgi:hypothetical protein
VVGPVDLAALRDARERRLGHHMLAHLRPELYPAYRTPAYPGTPAAARRTVEDQKDLIERTRRRLFPG